ncbi:hypothetical protein LRS40_01435 [Leclercia sp. G3L]|uniref:hypothetical protein n=1 Tax=Leclercia sp. G3L TaxID=2898725 RepID=UPI001E3846FC|nr:hypothetical protein [Leclercia sp. G3L]UGB05028.1 hypothetical protein LRS40_01435 [Leclercia sp. G3L]
MPLRTTPSVAEQEGQLIETEATGAPQKHHHTPVSWQHHHETNVLPKKHLNYLAYVPDFFQHRERGIRLNILPANADSYFFTYSNSPVMYCTKG